MTPRCSVACRRCSAGWWDDDPAVELGLCPYCAGRLVVTGDVIVIELR